MVIESSFTETFTRSVQFVNIEDRHFNFIEFLQPVPRLVAIAANNFAHSKLRQVLLGIPAWWFPVEETVLLLPDFAQGEDEYRDRNFLSDLCAGDQSAHQVLSHWHGQECYLWGMLSLKYFGTLLGCQGGTYCWEFPTRGKFLLWACWSDETSQSTQNYHWRFCCFQEEFCQMNGHLFIYYFNIVLFLLL